MNFRKRTYQSHTESVNSAIGLPIGMLGILIVVILIMQYAGTNTRELEQARNDAMQQLATEQLKNQRLEADIAQLRRQQLELCGAAKTLEMIRNPTP